MIRNITKYELNKILNADGERVIRNYLGYCDDFAVNCLFDSKSGYRANDINNMAFADHIVSTCCNNGLYLVTTRDNIKKTMFDFYSYLTDCDYFEDIKFADFAGINCIELKHKNGVSRVLFTRDINNIRGMEKIKFRGWRLDYDYVNDTIDTVYVRTLDNMLKDKDAKLFINVIEDHSNVYGRDLGGVIHYSKEFDIETGFLNLMDRVKVTMVNTAQIR